MPVLYSIKSIPNEKNQPPTVDHVPTVASVMVAWSTHGLIFIGRLEKSGETGAARGQLKEKPDKLH